MYSLWSLRTRKIWLHNNVVRGDFLQPPHRHLIPIICKISVLDYVLNNVVQKTTTVKQTRGFSTTNAFWYFNESLCLSTYCNKSYVWLCLKLFLLTYYSKEWTINLTLNCCKVIFVSLKFFDIFPWTKMLTWHAFNFWCLILQTLTRS